MRKTTPDPFVLENIVSNKKIEKQNNKYLKEGSNKAIRQQKNITFSLSLETIHLLEEVWFKLRRNNPKATKTAIVEFALKRTLSDIESIEL